MKNPDKKMRVLEIEIEKLNRKARKQKWINIFLLLSKGG